MTEFVSLIVCTVGRTEPLARLLGSLSEQRNPDFEILVVDQNDSIDIAPLLGAFEPRLTIRHVRSARGLSRARNVGLREARGSIVGFPDDDCWYGPEVTENVRRYFTDPECAVLTGRTLDRDGGESVSPHRPDSGFVDRDNVFASGNSNTLFVRTAVAFDVGGFDETLGVGSGTPFQSGEETDFLLRCLRKSYQVYYDRDFVVHHDQNNDASAAKIARAGAYSQGFGRLLRLHQYGVVYLGAGVGRALLRAALCLATGDVDGARRRYDWVKGALRGYLSGAVPREPAQRSFGLRG